MKILMLYNVLSVHTLIDYMCCGDQMWTMLRATISTMSSRGNEQIILALEFEVFPVLPGFMVVRQAIE